MPKKICKINRIPTANFKICENKKHILPFMNKNKFPIVKADGLAAGKVSLFVNRKQVINISNQIF